MEHSEQLELYVSSGSYSLSFFLRPCAMLLLCPCYTCVYRAAEAPVLGFSRTYSRLSQRSSELIITQVPKRITSINQEAEPNKLLCKWHENLG